ncbi:ATP-binding protein [Streptomyces sp. A012304]|uniref:ATP-binding protein n=1 Tax=Streptomyces sp. A012304 TaxID=375446 RepID=UPI00223237F6|nr:ATP-binding protein [Streptomyces sp. A012304]GKQ40004.1 ATP-binding protein [Streptomyces sp. A012304]
MNQEIRAPENHLHPRFHDFTVLLSPTPRGAHLARLLATEQLRSWGLPSDPAEQIVMELATNAATHGRVVGRDFRLSLYVIAGTLRIEVTDTRGDRLPRVRRPGGSADSGRGLLLVDALADRWGVVTEPFPRKTVWAEVGLRTWKSGAPDPGGGGRTRRVQG